MLAQSIKRIASVEIKHRALDMDRIVQKIVGRVAGTPTLKRRAPAVARGLLPAFAPSSNILDNMAISVVTLNDHAGGAGDSRATELRDMVSASGGVLCGDAKAEALVCDVRGIRSTENLTLLQSALQGPISKMPRNGRIVMIANDTSLLLGREQAVAAASAAAVQGFVKSMAKEVAGKGITANTLMASEDLDSRQGLSGPLLYFLSKRSSFVTGQTLKLSNNNQFRASENPGESFSVRGKRVVLTGASRGIGAYTAKLFSAEGADLLLVDHPSMEKTLSGFAATLGCKSVSLDVADAGSPAALKSSILKAFGDHHVDVVVHNAGITRDKSYKKMSAEGFKDVIDVNLSSIIRMDDMLFSDCFKAGSRAVYLSSISGIAGTFGQTNYGCSKAGVVGYVASLGASVQSHGIGVNAVAPGFIETEMTGKIPLLTRNVGRHMNALLQGGFPVDVAEAILFLSTPAAAGVNGNTLRVCGNHLLGA